MSDGKVMTFKNTSKAKYLSNEIRNFLHRGFETGKKLTTALNSIRAETGVRKLQNLSQEHIDKFVNNLKDKVVAGKLSSSTFTSYIASLNDIILYKNDKELHKISSKKDYGVSRNFTKTDGVNKENSRDATVAYKEWLHSKYQATKDLRYESLKHTVAIQAVNLRLRESLLVKLSNKDLSGNILKIAEKGDGSKNSRPREIQLNTEQKEVLRGAREFMKSSGLKNLNIGTLQQGRDFANNTLKQFRSENQAVSFHYHGERHARAHDEYKTAWAERGYDNIECRARMGETKADWQNRIMAETGLSRSEFKNIDNSIRQDISHNLGHERPNISDRYLG